ncbi:MAG TPA: hypothetical protein VFU76_11730, partial [Terriglobales bacterium]|nr:hypothetical protein [Terriglobales bacterium]
MLRFMAEKNYATGTALHKFSRHRMSASEHRPRWNTVRGVRICTFCVRLRTIFDSGDERLQPLLTAAICARRRFAQELFAR